MCPSRIDWCTKLWLYLDFVNRPVTNHFLTQIYNIYSISFGSLRVSEQMLFNIEAWRCGQQLKVSCGLDQRSKSDAHRVQVYVLLQRLQLQPRLPLDKHISMWCLYHRYDIVFTAATHSWQKYFYLICVSEVQYCTFLREFLYQRRNHYFHRLWRVDKYNDKCGERAFDNDPVL